MIIIRGSLKGKSHSLFVELDEPSGNERREFSVSFHAEQFLGSIHKSMIAVIAYQKNQ
jgi:hypothetical protein